MKQIKENTTIEKTIKKHSKNVFANFLKSVSTSAHFVAASLEAFVANFSPEMFRLMQWFAVDSSDKTLSRRWKESLCIILILFLSKTRNFYSNYFKIGETYTASAPSNHSNLERHFTQLPSIDCRSKTV